MAGAALLNFFTLHKAGVLIAQGVDRRALEPLLERAHQERRAAASLWSLGQRAEALRLIQKAVQSSLVCAAQATGADPKHVSESLTKLAIGDAGKLAAEIDLILTSEVPELDRRFSEAHASTYADALKTVNVVLRAIDEGFMGPRTARVMRVQRVSSAIAVVVVGAALGLWVRDLMLRETVTGSARHARHLGPDNLVDGNLDTEWVLPAETPGWAEISPRGPVSLEGLKIVNGSHAPDNDRLTREARITIMSVDGEAQTHNVSFDEQKSRELKVLKFRAEDVIRVRIEIIGWYKAGAALSEVELLRD